jgi:hypothetical protein
VKQQESRPAANGAAKDLAGELISPNSTRYPERIVLSEAAESYLNQLGEDLVLGRVEYFQLPTSLRQLYWFGWLDGNDCATADRIRRLEDECDRLYRLAFDPPTLPDPNQPSFAELLRRRGESEEAERYESFVVALLQEGNR